MPALTVTGSPTLNGDGSCTLNQPSDRVTAPSTGMSATTGWAAARVMMLYPSTQTTAPAAGEPVWFAWVQDGSHYMYAAQRYADQGTTGWGMQRTSAGAGDTTFAVESWAVNDKRTVIYQWTATTLGFAVNTVSSGNIATVGNTDIPALSAALDLGSFAGGEQFASEIFWLAWGAGTLTNTDAATIQGYTDTTPPGVTSWPGAAVGLWLGTSFNYSTPTSNPIIRNEVPFMSNMRI